MKSLNISKKVLASLVMSSLMFGSFAFFSPVKAANPEIDKVKDRGRKSVTLRVQDKRFKNDKVRIKVTVTDRKTGKEFTKSFTEKLDSEGKETVRIGGLDPSTEYKFKVRVRETNDKNYRGSDSKVVTTKSL